MSRDAQRLAAAFRGGERLSALDVPPATVAQAYALQDAMREELGLPIIGWKLAQTTAKAQAPLGLEAPTVSPLLEGMIVPAQTVFAAGHFHSPEIEAEIVLELSSTIDRPLGKGELIDCIGHLRLGIEVADTRYVDKAAVGVLSVIADLNSSGALVIGPRVDVSNLNDAVTGPAEARLGDGTLVTALPADMRPSPLDVLAYLAEFATARGHSIPAGAMVTTGTHTRPTRSGPGTIGALFQNVGRLTARLSEPAA
ncbi:MAG: fumarylacetoacetate hydrolase family protein [Pseudomonadota bacterium]